MSFIKKQKGSTTIEFAITIPIFLIIIIGLIIFPLSSFFTKTVLIDATRESARHYAIHFEDGDSAKKTAENIAILTMERNGLEEEGIVGAVDFDTSSCGDYVVVSIAYQNPSPLMEAIPLEMNTGVLHASSVFKKEFYEEPSNG